MLKMYLIFFLFVLLGCADQSTSNGQIYRASKKEILNKIFTKTVPVKQDQALLYKMSQFQNILNSGGPKTKQDWKIHDELLDSYIKLKRQVGGVNEVVINPNSNLKIRLDSFCLNSSAAAPHENEKFYWHKADPQIPYYRQIIQLAAVNKDARNEIQELLWNLQKKTRWEDYPDKLKSILLSIDPKAKDKLPSRLNYKIKGFATDFLKDQVPGLSEAEDLYSQVNDKFQDFNSLKKEIEGRTSHQPLNISTDELEPVNGTPLFAETESNGFSSQEITFYNPTIEPVKLDLTEYHLVPYRSDVQRIGLFRPFLGPSNLLSELEKLLFDRMLRLGIGFTPVLNDVADLYELLKGQNFVSRESFTWPERMLSGLGLLVGSGEGFRYAKRMMAAPERYAVEFEKGFERVTGRSIGHLDGGEITRAVEAAEETAKNVRKSPTLEKIYSSPDFKKADFFIRPNGEVLPAKGYRYIGSDSPKIGEMMKDGVLKGDSARPTFVSFDKIENPSLVRSKLQLPEGNNGRMRIEFDTLEVAEDLHIPHGRYGTAEWLEPITKDFPLYGEGGATQAITNSTITIRELKDLQTGKVLIINSR